MSLLDIDGIREKQDELFLEGFHVFQDTLMEYMHSTNAKIALLEEDINQINATQKELIKDSIEKMNGIKEALKSLASLRGIRK